MAAVSFKDNDNYYRAWLDQHPTGYVLNIDEKEVAKIHRVACRYLTNMPIGARHSTHKYPKICSTDLADLFGWPQESRECRHCAPTDQSGLSPSLTRAPH